MVFAGCINEINRDALDFPDNPTEDYDSDGLTEQQGDCNDLDDDVEDQPLVGGGELEHAPEVLRA